MILHQQLLKSRIREISNDVTEYVRNGYSKAHNTVDFSHRHSKKKKIRNCELLHKKSVISCIR